MGILEDRKAVLLLMIIGILGLFRFSPFTFTQEEVLYVPVTITIGDTLWDIAALTADESQDIRRVLYHIQEENHLSVHEKVKPGQVVFVPVEKERLYIVSKKLENR